MSSGINEFMTGKRWNNLSVYRTLATIAVLQFHVFYILYARDIPYETLLSKGVQGLTVLSGFLYSQKFITDIKGFYLGSLKKLLIPATACFLFMATWNVVYMLITKNWDYVSLFFDHRAYNQALLVQPGNYYFLAYIFVCYLMTPLLQKGGKWALFTSLGVIAFEIAIGFFTGYSLILVCYLIGYFIGKRCFATYVDTTHRYNPLLLLFWAVLTAGLVALYALLIQTAYPQGYFLAHLYMLSRNIAMTCFGASTFFLIIYALRFLNRFKQPRFLTYIDKLTLVVYLLNQAYLCGAMNVSLYVEPMWAKTLLVYAFVVITSIVIERLLALFHWLRK